MFYLFTKINQSWGEINIMLFHLDNEYKLITHLRGVHCKMICHPEKMLVLFLVLINIFHLFLLYDKLIFAFMDMPFNTHFPLKGF